MGEMGRLEISVDGRDVSTLLFLHKTVDSILFHVFNYQKRLLNQSQHTVWLIPKIEQASKTLRLLLATEHDTNILSSHLNFNKTGMIQVQLSHNVPHSRTPTLTTSGRTRQRHKGSFDHIRDSINAIDRR